MKHSAASGKPHGYQPVPNYTRDWDEDGNGYLDTQEFAAYAIKVKGAIEDLGEPCIADIKRALPEDNHRYLMDSLESLMSIGAIKQTREVSPLRYAIHTPFAEPKKKKFLIGITPRKNPTPDQLQIFGKQARY